MYWHRCTNRHIHFGLQTERGPEFSTPLDDQTLCPFQPIETRLIIQQFSMLHMTMTALFIPRHAKPEPKRQNTPQISPASKPCMA